MQNSFAPAIAQLDLQSVLTRLKHEHPTLDTQQAEVEYRQFLQLCLEDSDITTPTKLADHVWHYHILDTQKYAADCEALFGKFIHHMPKPETAHCERTAAHCERTAAHCERTAAHCERISALCSR